MPSAVRWVLGIAVVSVSLLALVVGAAVNAVYAAETISVSVRAADGGNIHVAVPAGVAEIALAGASLVPDGSWPLGTLPDDALDALDRYLPVAQDAIDALAAQPDFVLVDARSEDEHVVVRKVGRQLRVFVESGEGTIDVSLPLSTVKELSKRLRRISRAS